VFHSAVNRTIKYQIEFIRSGNFYINDNLGNRYNSTRQKLIRCGNLGLVLAYYFASINLVIVIYGWIAWPILIYDGNKKIIALPSIVLNEDIDNYKIYLDSLNWNDGIAIEDSKCLLIGFNSNIAHFFHNELSALHNLCLSNDIKNIDKIICGAYIPFDLPKFLLFLGISVKVEPYQNEQVLFEQVSKSRFVVRVTDITFSKKLSNDLIRFGHTSVGATKLTSAQDVCKILITIRTGRRRLLNITEILVAAIRFLNNYLGKILVIFDGVTSVSYHDTSDLVRAESNIVNDVIEGVNAGPEVSYESIIGQSLEEKIVAINQCDFAITNMGNGFLPTIQWISDIPSFVHGNSTELGIFWDTNLGEDLKRPFVISPRVVKDSSLNTALVAGQWEGRQDDSYRIDTIDFLDQLSIFLTLKYFN
jgi:hypothetical protein